MHLSTLSLEIIAGFSILVMAYSTFTRNWPVVMVSIITMILCGLALAFRFLGAL